MLISEGFEYNDYIDIFDGGPVVDARGPGYQDGARKPRIESQDVFNHVEGDDTCSAAAV
ncbi:MAG: arginine N-succinyltransferase [Parvularculaceae bacterium]